MSVQQVSDPLPYDVASLVSVEFVKACQSSDIITSQLLELVETRVPVKSWPCALAAFKRLGSHYFLVDGLLVVKRDITPVPVVPWSLCIELVVSLHRELAHIGRDKMLHLLRQHVFHPNLYMVARDVCATCPECQLMKVARIVHMPPTLKIVTEYPFELVA